MNKIFDVIIVGGGPIGLACGVEAQKHDLDYLILEKGALTNSIYNYPINMRFFSTSDRLEMAGIPFMSVENKPTRTEALEYYRRIFFHFKLNVNLYEGVEKLERPGDHFQITTSKGIYQTRKIVLATGFYDLPNLMNVPGEELPKVMHYYKEPWPFIGQKILVVGGANSAVDAALETWRKGAEVSMVLLGDEVDDNVKYWVRPDIMNRIKEGSIRAFTRSKVKEI
nr:YpdA family putative bacillithiol disulfide reductase [Algoriphagus sp.]